MKITVDQVKEHAELGAEYFLALIKRDIDAQTAIELTVRYVQALLIVLFNTSPKEPWET